jgi:hypothetical protein
MYRNCIYIVCYSSSCPSSPPFSVHHFARSPSDTHISGGGFVAYTKSSPFEVRNEWSFTITFREFPCLLHKLPKQVSTTVINLILFGSCLVRNPLRDPSILNDFFSDTFSPPSTLKRSIVTSASSLICHLQLYYISLLRYVKQLITASEKKNQISVKSA